MKIRYIFSDDQIDFAFTCSPVDFESDFDFRRPLPSDRFAFCAASEEDERATRAAEVAKRNGYHGVVVYRVSEFNGQKHFISKQ